MEFDVRSAIILIALTLPLIALWVVTFWDIARRRDLPAGRKLIWSVAIVLTAYIGIAAYAIMRPIPPPPGKARSKTTPRASAIVESLEALVAAHAAGEIADEAFDRQKREILGLA